MIATHAVGDTQEEIDDFFAEKGWTDGLPVVAPTRDRIDRMLEASGADPDEVIGPVPVSNRILDMTTLAVNAVMAGCRAVHLPVLKAAATAILRPEFNLAGVTATTHPAGPMVIVSGGAVDAVGFNAGAGALGPGNRAGAVVGRALRLVLYTVGGAQPGIGDKATHGHPGKYAYVVAENEPATPWDPLRIQHGHAAESSTVTVVAAEAPRNVNDHGSAGADQLIQSIAGTAASLGHNNLHRGGPIVIVLSPEHAAVLGRAGMSPAEFRQKVFDSGRVPMAMIPEANLERFRRIRPQRFSGDPATTSLSITLDPAELIPVVSGGPGRHSMVIPSFGITEAVTVPIDQGRRST